MVDKTHTVGSNSETVVTRRNLLRATGVLTTGSMLAGCAGGSNSGNSNSSNSGNSNSSSENNSNNGNENSANKQVVIAPAAGPTTLDPHNHNETTTSTILIHFYDGLVMRNNEMKIKPRLAKDWENPDPTTWKFSLRKGIKFTNGEPFNSEVVKYNLERVSGLMKGSETLPIQSRYESIKNIETPGKYSVRVNLKNPDPLFLAYQSMLRYIPKKYTEKNGFEALNKHPIGTGPYKLKKWQRNNQLIQEAKPDYFRGKPAVDTITWNPTPEASSRLASLLQGNTDLIRSVNPRSENRVNNSGNAKVESVRSDRSAALWMNLEQSIPGRGDSLFYNQPKLRKAVNYALDIDSIIKNILSNHGTRTHGWAINKRYVGYNSNITPYQHDPKKAQRLLKEAGYSDGFKAELLVPRGRYFKGVATAQAIASQLGNVGINVDLNTVEFGQFAQQTKDGDIPEFMLAAWGNSTFSALSSYTQLVETDGIFSLLPKKNAPDWAKRVDKNIERAKTTTEKQKENSILQKLEKTIHKNALFAQLFEYEDLYGVNNGLNFQPRTDELMYMYNKNSEK